MARIDSTREIKTSSWPLAATAIWSTGAGETDGICVNPPPPPPARVQVWRGAPAISWAEGLSGQSTLRWPFLPQRQHVRGRPLEAMVLDKAKMAPWM